MIYTALSFPDEPILELLEKGIYGFYSERIKDLPVKQKYLSTQYSYCLHNHFVTVEPAFNILHFKVSLISHPI
jgi:hypothetical protein